MGKRTSEGYIGMARQKGKGQPEAPTKFFRLSAADTIEMLQEISVYRELDGDQLISNIVKNIHTPDGTFSFYARPDTIAAILTWVLGDDEISEAGPFLHTITRTDALSWLTIEKYLDTVERIADCKINQVIIEGTSGQPTTVEVSFLGLTPGIEASPEGTPTYEADDKFMFYDGDGLYKLDGDVIANICFFRITISRNIVGSQQDAFLRSDLVELGFDIDVELRLKFAHPETPPSPTSEFYKKVLYGGGTAAVAALDGGSVTIKQSYGEGVKQRYFQIYLPSLKHIAVQKFLDPEPAELEVPCVAKAIKPATGEIITVTCGNITSTAYSD